MQESSGSATIPKLVVGGIGVVIKKRKRTSQPSSCASNNSNTFKAIPSILTSIPDNTRLLSSKASENEKGPTSEDEFGDDTLLKEEINDLPNDTLLCLQAYTRAAHGTTSETCAYCPIFTLSHDIKQGSISEKSISSTHAAPFLPHRVLLHLSTNHTQTKQDIKELAAANKVRFLQLHGTAVAKYGLGWRGDGNDDDDIAVMETCAYEIAAKMALETHCDCHEKSKYIFEWFRSLLLPNFICRIWISNPALDAFIESIAAVTKSELNQTNIDDSERRFTTSEMNKIIRELVDSGLLLPRRGLGLNGGEGYWFSLPGLGRAAKSIADGRLSILRRIQSSPLKEKKRSSLEQTIAKFNKTDWSGKKKDYNTNMQSGKFQVLDLLAKGFVYIHETCTGEQYVCIKL